MTDSLPTYVYIMNTHQWSGFRGAVRQRGQGRRLDFRVQSGGVVRAGEAVARGQ